MAAPDDMAALPPPLGDGALKGWRLDQAPFKSAWNGGEGAFLHGGRWNNPGVRAVYCALDPATAVLEVAVHKGFRALDAVAHVLTSFAILDPSDVVVVDAAAIPNANWLRLCPPSAGQRSFGDALLRAHKFVLIPSAVSTRSWSLIFDTTKASGAYALRAQEAFALDTRLHPPPGFAP